jgi:hypothetical protein
MLFDADLMAGDDSALLKYMAVLKLAAVLKSCIIPFSEPSGHLSLGSGRSNRSLSISHPIFGGEYGLEL